MKNTRIICCLAAVAALHLMAGNLLADTTLLRTTADAHINGNFPDLNFNTETVNISQTDQGGQKAYLLFDASGWGTTNISRVGGIRVVTTTSLTRTYAADLITGTGANDWTESGICWTNAPANNVAGTARDFVAYDGQTVKPLGSMSGGGAVGTVVTIPIAPASAAETELLNALNTGSRKVTIGIRYNSSQSSVTGFYSREHGDGTMAAALEILPPEGVLPVVMDAYVNSTYPDVPFGTADNLAIGPTELGGKKAYLLFDASSLGSTQLERAERVRFYYSGSVNVTRTMMFVLLSGTGVNDWTETEITWNNAPANNSTTSRDFVAYPGQSVITLGSTQYVAGAPREMNLQIPEGSAGETALLNALNTGDRKATIGVSYSSTSTTTDIGIYSRERSEGIYTATLWFGEKTPVVPSIGWVGFSEGHPVLELNGPANANYTVLSSTNMTDWAERETVSVAQPPMQWTDLAAGAESRRFYRVRVP